MKGNVDLGIVEFSAEDMKQTPEELKRELERKQSKYENMLLELEEEKKSLQEVGDVGLEIVDTVGLEDRTATALGILEKERQMQIEREKEWEKEKRSKKRKRFFKTFCLVTVCVILFLAWLSGYRIPIPDSWVITIQGIYNSAYNTVVSYFTGH